MTDPRDRYVALPVPARAVVVLGVALLGWAVVASVAPRGLPLGIILLGAAFGALYGLVAIGLVLVYRASRVVNFAQAEFGSLAGVIAIYLAVQRGWSYFLAIAVGLVIGALTGAAVEVLVLRRFRTAPRLIVTVATIGLAQLLNGMSVLLALRISGLRSGSFETPFSVELRVRPVIFTGDHVVVGVVVAGVLAALVVLLRRTDYGIALRAAADSGDRARLLGIPVNRLSTIVWSCAGLVSAIGIILRVPLTGFQSFTSISGGGTSLLLRALAAAVIARMDRFGVAVVAGVALGVVEVAASWSYGNTAYADGILVLVILVSLLVQRTDFSRVVEGLQATSTFQAIREVRPVPSELVRLPEIVWGTRALRLAVVLLAVAFPLWATPSRVELMSLVFIYALVAVSLVVLTGWAGHISLGHWAIAGLGGATMSVLYGRHDVDLFVAAAAGIAVAALIAMAIGVPALRVRGPFLAVTTLAFAVTASTLLLNSRYVPWLVGDLIERPALFDRIALERGWHLYYLDLAALVVAIAAVQALRRSRSGRALVALRDNLPNAAAFGISPVRLQLAAFAISGALAGAAGVLYALHQGGIRQDSFDAIVGLRIFSMVVIGGLGSIAGGVAGAAFVRGGEYFLSPGLALLFSGVGILVLLLLSPGGVGELMYRARDRALRMIAARRGLVVPSLVADSATGERAPSATAAPRTPPDATAALSIRGLDVAYDGVQVLFGVDLDVEDGEILALVGTNGAGKSTLLRAVSGILAPQAGSVWLHGEDLTGADPATTVGHGIVMLPGGRGVFPSLTVAEHFRIGGWSQRADTAHVRAATERALEIFPVLQRRWETPAGSLSGGEQQMLCLALALLTRPRLLLIDELTLGLAPIVVEQLLTMVHEIHANGSAIVIVEQSITTALRLAQRAVFMEKGEVRYSGPTAELLERPDLLRAVFLGSAGGRPRVRARLRAAPSANGHADATVVLESQALSKQYGGVVATRDVSFTLHADEILGMIGPNGAGKTTLFDLVCGYVHADRGSVLLHGADITDQSPHARAQAGLGRSFQDARLWPSLTVAEAIAVARERHVAVASPLPALFGLPAVAESEAAVTVSTDALVEVLGLGAFRDKFVAELSTGTRRVVELACLLAHEPSVLLLDEPSSGVAQRETEALGPVLRDIRRELGCSILLIDHDLPLVLGLVDRLLVLDQGAVLAVGRPDEVMRDDRVTSAYLGGDVGSSADLAGAST